MTFYTCITILTELIMLAMMIHVCTHSAFTKSQKKWFLLTFAAVMCCAAAEYAVHCGFYDPKYAIPLTVITVLQFSTSPLLGIFFSEALGRNRNRNAAVVIFYCINLLAECVAAPFGWIFSFGAEGYTRGPLFLIYEAFYFVSLLYLLISMVHVGRNFRHRDQGTIVMILIILVAGIVPMTLFKIQITYLAIAISAGLSYIYYNDLIQQDIQTKLISDQETISQMQERIISGLANLIENRDLETGEHVTRTSEFVRMLSEFARADGVYPERLNDHAISLIYRAAPLHDVGKIVVSDDILKKPGRLTEEEFGQMKRHAAEGGRIVREVLGSVADSDYLSIAEEIASCHHERWDGKGYPAGLAGEEVPLSARIMAIADVFDALVSERCYKKAMPAEKAFEIIREEAGTHFDPLLVRVFLDHSAAFISSGTAKEDLTPPVP
ncbi:MAG: HD domain-containing protein [Oscillospiraceae bacterium]|nr:HD domain-containing protein [Oscillospiraceae bacterium]